ncbi:MAG: hypothetical protein WAO91_03000 [Candidatus Nitrosotenuis sp.]
MEIIYMLRQPKYLALAVLSSLGMLALYAYSQVLGAVGNLDLWISVMPWYNKMLLSTFVVLFGMATAYQVYAWRQPKSCNLSVKGGTVGANSAGTFGVFLVSQCPACSSIAALFLPFSATLLIATYGWLINLAGIAIVLFTINYLGGFKK